GGGGAGGGGAGHRLGAELPPRLGRGGRPRGWALSPSGYGAFDKLHGIDICGLELEARLEGAPKRILDPPLQPQVETQRVDPVEQRPLVFPYRLLEAPDADLDRRLRRASEPQIGQGQEFPVAPEVVIAVGVANVGC